jgi:hypothetical protein
MCAGGTVNALPVLRLTATPDDAGSTRSGEKLCL